MEDEQLREFAAFDGDVAWIVVHGLRRVQPLQLAARRLRLEDQGGKLPGPGVDAGRQTGGAHPDAKEVGGHGRPGAKAPPSSTLCPPASPRDEESQVFYKYMGYIRTLRKQRQGFLGTLST